MRFEDTDSAVDSATVWTSQQIPHHMNVLFNSVKIMYKSTEQRSGFAALLVLPTTSFASGNKTVQRLDHRVFLPKGSGLVFENRLPKGPMTKERSSKSGADLQQSSWDTMYLLNCIVHLFWLLSRFYISLHTSRTVGDCFCWRWSCQLPAASYSSHVCQNSWIGCIV